VGQESRLGLLHKATWTRRSRLRRKKTLVTWPPSPPRVRRCASSLCRIQRDNRTACLYRSVAERDVSAPEVSSENTALPSPAGKDHPPAHLTSLAERARGYVEAASSANTRKAYASDWKHFAAWCRRSNLAPLPPHEVVYLTGRPVHALNDWMTAARVESGSVFRKVDRWGNVSKRALEPSAVNHIVKQRAAMAGLEPGEFSAHGLRSGYLTEAANRGVPLPEAMEQSRHRSVQQASSYYNSATRRSGRAARLL
jgi:hypothetical protein